MSSPPPTSADADHFFQTLLTHDEPTSFTASTSSPSSSLLQLAPELSTSARPISFSSAFSQPQRRSAAGTATLSTAGATFASGAFDLPFGGPDDPSIADETPIAGPGPNTVAATLARAAVADPYQLPPAATDSGVGEAGAYEALLREPSRSRGAGEVDTEISPGQMNGKRDRGSHPRGVAKKRAALVDDDTTGDDAARLTAGRGRGHGRPRATGGQRGRPKKSAALAVVEANRMDDIAVDPALGAASSSQRTQGKGKGRARSNSAASSSDSADAMGVDDDLDDPSGLPNPPTPRSASASPTRSASGSPQPKKSRASKSKPRKTGKKPIDPPIVPRLFRSAAGQLDPAGRTSRPNEGEGEMTEEQNSELERAMDP
ncbi:hypothetical protein JCM5296_000875, partial [Sporobolomyces johnsonii]